MEGHELPNTDKTRKSTLSEEIYRRLAESITTGEFPRGSRLIEADLCDRYGVSRTPLRAALAKLERDHLIQTEPHKGCVVRGHSREDIDELYELRKILEGAAIELAASRVRNDQLDRLSDLIEARKNMKTVDDRGELADIDKQTHLLVAGSCGNSWLVGMIEMVLRILHVYRHLDLRIEARARQAIIDHEKLVDSLRTGDGAMARELMCRHIETSKQSVLSHFAPLLDRRTRPTGAHRAD